MRDANEMLTHVAAKLSIFVLLGHALVVVHGFPSPTAQPVGEPTAGNVTDTITTGTMDVYRLPGHTVPVSYALKLVPDYEHLPDAVDLDGELRMVIDVKRRTSRLTFNYRNLVVCVAYVHNRRTWDDVEVVDIFYDAENEQVHLVLADDLQEDQEYVVDIEFHVTIRKGMDGFYRSAYYDPDGVER